MDDPLDDILRKFHLECCENVEITRKFECPTLGWKYPRQMLTMVSVLESHALSMYTNSLVNADSFYANFNNTTFQKVPIPHLTRPMKQKFLH